MKFNVEQKCSSKPIATYIVQASKPAGSFFFISITHCLVFGSVTGSLFSNTIITYLTEMLMCKAGYNTGDRASMIAFNNFQGKRFCIDLHCCVTRKRKISTFFIVLPSFVKYWILKLSFIQILDLIFLMNAGYEKVYNSSKNCINAYELALCIFDYEYTKTNSVAIRVNQVRRQYSIKLNF